MLFFQVALFLAAVYALVRILYPKAFSNSKKQKETKMSAADVQGLKDLRQQLLQKKGELLARKEEKQIRTNIADIDAILNGLDDKINEVKDQEEK